MYKTKLALPFYIAIYFWGVIHNYNIVCMKGVNEGGINI